MCSKSYIFRRIKTIFLNLNFALLQNTSFFRFFYGNHSFRPWLNALYYNTPATLGTTCHWKWGRVSAFFTTAKHKKIEVRAAVYRFSWEYFDKHFNFLCMKMLENDRKCVAIDKERSVRNGTIFEEIQKLSNYLFLQPYILHFC